MKRLIVISDLHCGHRAGLTPPGWQYSHDHSDKDVHKFAHVQQQLWSWYEKTINSLKPIHALICNGDMIDGPGYKAGGTEQITTDINKQVKMASESIGLAEAKKVRLTYGTPYHTGYSRDDEDQIADAVHGKIGAEDNYECNGIVFNCKHAISRSAVPHGRFTALARAKLWNELWSLREGYPLANVIIRSHVHYFVAAQDAYAKMFITPALQLYTKYGTRQCEGIVNVGLLQFDIEKNGDVMWRPHFMKLNGLVKKPELL